MSQGVMEKPDKNIFPIISDSAGCCPGAEEPEAKPPDVGQTFVTGSVATPVGRLPRVSSQLTWRDHWGAIKARWGVGRMDYSIDPGLYALGAPDRESARPGECKLQDEL